MVRSEPLHNLQAFVQDVDWEMLEAVVDIGESAVRYVRDHPWTLIAAGGALAGIGLWDLLTDRRVKKPKVTYTEDPYDYDVMAP